MPPSQAPSQPRPAQQGAPFSLTPQCRSQLRLGSTPRPFLRRHSSPASTFSRPRTFSMGTICVLRGMGNRVWWGWTDAAHRGAPACLKPAELPQRRRHHNQGKAQQHAAPGAPPACPRHSAQRAPPASLFHLEHHAVQQQQHVLAAEAPGVEEGAALGLAGAQQAQQAQPDLAGYKLPPVLPKVLQKGGGGEAQRAQRVGWARIARAVHASPQRPRSSSSIERRSRNSWPDMHGGTQAQAMVAAPAAGAACRRSCR